MHQVETVGDSLGAAVAPSGEDTLGHRTTLHQAAEQTVDDGDVGVEAMSQDAADVITTDNVSCYLAILNPAGAVGKAHQSCCVLHRARIDGAVDSQVLDSSIVDIAEGSGTLVLRVGNRGSDGVSIAVEYTAEGITLRRLCRHSTHYLRDFDVGIQAYVLTRITLEARVEVGNVRSKCIPVIRAVYDVWILLRTLARNNHWHDIPLRVEDDSI